MTACTVALRIKSTVPVVTDTTEFAGVDIIHGDRDGSLLHFGEHFLVVAIFALVTSFFVQCAVEQNRPHRAFVNSMVFFAGTARAIVELTNKMVTIRMANLGMVVSSLVSMLKWLTTG